MNWVGGKLSRHRRGKGWKEDMANQEQYFAKARSWQREHAKISPVALSAANFIPNYSVASKTVKRAAGSSPSSSLAVPLGTSNKPSANLANPSQIMQDDVTERTLRVVPPRTSGSAVFNNQSTEAHLVGTSDLEAERRRLLKEEDLLQSKLPNFLIARPTQKRGRSAASGQIIGQHQRPGKSTSHCEMRPNAGGQRGSRKRRLSQTTSSRVDTTIRIRVGSRNYQWSEGRNSIKDPTYNSECSSPSRSAGKTRCMTSSTGNTSYVIDKSLTRLSSPAISSLLWISPGNNRPTYRRKFSGPTQHVSRAASAKSQCPMTVYTNRLSLKPPPVSMPTWPAANSVGSMVVEVGNGQEPPKISIDEEQIWRAWLNVDMPEFQVPEYRT
ncbi:hypothetical protein GGI43DRAFT_421321 [Trichoderma evansii]